MQIARNRNGCCCTGDCANGVGIFFNDIEFVRNDECLHCDVASGSRHYHNIAQCGFEVSITTDDDGDFDGGGTSECVYDLYVVKHILHCSPLGLNGLFEIAADTTFAGTDIATACVFERSYFGYFTYRDLWSYEHFFDDDRVDRASDDCLGSSWESVTINAGNLGNEQEFPAFKDQCEFVLRAEFKGDKFYVIAYIPRSYTLQKCFSEFTTNSCTDQKITLPATLFFFGVMDIADLDMGGVNTIDNLVAQQCYDTPHGPIFRLRTGVDADSTPTIKVTRTDTGAVVISTTTSGVSHDSTGNYSYTLGSPVAGVFYVGEWAYTEGGVSSGTSEFRGPTYLPDEVAAWCGSDQDCFANFCIGGGGSVDVTFPTTPHNSQPTTFPCLSCNEFCDNCCPVIGAAADQDCSGADVTPIQMFKKTGMCQWEALDDVTGTHVIASVGLYADPATDPPTKKWFFGWDLGPGVYFWTHPVIDGQNCPPMGVSGDTSTGWEIVGECDSGRTPIIGLGCGEGHECHWCQYEATWDYAGDCADEVLSDDACWDVHKVSGVVCVEATENPWPDTPIYPTWGVYQSDSGSDCKMRTVVVSCDGSEPSAPGTPNELPTQCIRCPGDRGLSAATCCNNITITYEDDDGVQTIYLAKVDSVPSGDTTAYSWFQLNPSNGHFEGVGSSLVCTSASESDPIGHGDRWKLQLYDALLVNRDVYYGPIVWYTDCPPGLHGYLKGVSPNPRPNGHIVSMVFCAAPP